MQIQTLEKYITSGKFDNVFSELYISVSENRARYLRLLQTFRGQFGEADVRLFSAPGRTEIGGNHTDHQNGCVLAAAIHLDAIACAAARPGGIDMLSEGYAPIRVNLFELAPRKNEAGSAALIRGVCAYLQKEGYRIGGFCACAASDVTGGSGLSSSAAFSVLVGAIVSYLFNGGTIPAEVLARAGQYAENEYFGKPSGLMDQTACAVGGFVDIDFGTQPPRVDPVKFDFRKVGHSLCIVDTKDSHAGLNEEYASVKNEMTAIARALEKQTLSEVSLDEILQNLPRLRGACGDRAALRGLHFVRETRRAVAEKEALRQGRYDEFLRLVNESGESSAFLLQNIYPAGADKNQAAAVALAVSKLVLRGRGACRIHGGGFGGTIQAFVPDDLLADYRAALDGVFGGGACRVMQIRGEGAIELPTAAR